MFHRRGLAFRNVAVAIVSLLFTYLFFAEYLPPFRRLYIPYDLGGFHYPLVSYAFQALREGRFPQWDPTTYGGMPFAANTQVALFYPGTWLALAANFTRQIFSFQALEDFVLLHVWLAFVLCFLWLNRRLSLLACVCGAGVYAYSGYALLQLQHLGLMVAYAWIPFGMLGIDEAAESRSLVPLWKVVVASAFAFLGGYVPSWFVGAICMLNYALFRKKGWKLSLLVTMAIVASMLVAAVQLLPAIHLSSLRQPEARYGSGFRDPAFFASYIVPNLYDFSLSRPVMTNFGREYLYLGGPGLVGLLLSLFLWRPSQGWGSIGSIGGVLAVCVVLVTNPWGLVWKVVQHSTLLAQVCRDYYFLAGLSLAFAALAGAGIDRFLWRPARRLPVWLAIGVLCLATIWCLHLWMIWRRDLLLVGWESLWDTLAAFCLFFAGLFVLRTQVGISRLALGAGLLLAMGVDYKVHGTGKRVNATLRPLGFDPARMDGIDPAVFARLRRDRTYRIAIDETGPSPLELRHFQLSTPQGFDPFLSSDYKTFIERIGTFRTNWEFNIDPDNQKGLEVLGVRYFMTNGSSALFHQLNTNVEFKLLDPSISYYKIFELSRPKPIYGWDNDNVSGAIEVSRWEPERREFTVRLVGKSAKFHLSEQWNPGWTAEVDGMEVPVEKWNIAFQAISVPPGIHNVRFRFRDKSLRLGAVVSILAIGGLVALLCFANKVGRPHPLLRL